jgi:hypothetical protein
MQWLQDPNHSNVDNLNNVRSVASRHSRNKEKEYLEVKIDKFETNSKIKNIRDLYRGISNFKKGYHPRTNIVKDEKGDLVTDFHSISARWWNHFSQLLHVHGVHDFRQTEIYMAGTLVPKSSASEV